MDEKMLNKLMLKHGISEAELSEDTIETMIFEYHGAEQKKILLQVIYKVTDRTDIFHEYCYTRSERPCRTKLGADVTAAQKIEIEFLFDFYVRQYQKECAMLLEAFIQKHNLFGEAPSDKDAPDITLEEMAKMSKFMSSMEDVSPIRMLEAARQ